MGAKLVYFLAKIGTFYLTAYISIDELYSGFCKLQIINIFLGADDNPQLIFESLNSTGMDLSEGDKIRNYILMGLTPISLQEQYYEKYWYHIERNTGNNVSLFFRDYLSIKMQATPSMNKIYLNFKDFMELKTFSNREDLLKDLLGYARRYESLLKANSNISRLNSCIERMNLFEATVSRPFLMEALRHFDQRVEQNSFKNAEELIKLFELTESYIFRRSICDIPTNALNKVFVALNYEILRLDGTSENYYEKLKFVLFRKTGTSQFPNDALFSESLSTKPIYLLRSKVKQYIMERFENSGTKEVKDVRGLISEGTYSIEHIMPQTLSSEWKSSLGPEHSKIHEEWLHRLANLTLTAYNSSYSNQSFINKKNHDQGFIKSGIRMNQQLGHLDQWTLKELQERNESMMKQALSIWPMVKSTYQPPSKFAESFSLADDISYKNMKIARYSLLGEDEVVTSWTEMYQSVIERLHSIKPLILLDLATSPSRSGPASQVSESEEPKLIEIDKGLWLNVNLNTDSKIGYLRKFFELYGIEESELIFYLSDQTGEDEVDENIGNTPLRKIKRKGFWRKALPVIKEQTGRFLNCSPTSSNWSSTYLGHGGITISLVANYDNIMVKLRIDSKDRDINTSLYEYLLQNQNQFSEYLRDELQWSNNGDVRYAQLMLENKSFGIEDEEKWNSCIEYMVSGVNLFSQYLVPLVNQFFESI